jgi:glycosyltransferase involved in cell wall biosynthesis
MIAFLLAKPTQFDAPFFQWLHTYRPDMPFKVYYWKPVENSADTDTETGASLTWGINLLSGYPWQFADPDNPMAFQKEIRKQQVRYLVCNGWKHGFKKLIAAAKHQRIPMGLRIDSVLWGKSAIEIQIRRLVLKGAYQPFSQFFSSGSICDKYLIAMNIPPMRWRRWPYCIDNEFFSPNPQILAKAAGLKKQFGLTDDPVFLGICKWVPRENPMELLEAFVALNNPDLQLVMIGDGPLRPKLEVLRKQYPHLKIIFPGYVPYVTLPAWYACAKVFVHPAAYEPWGVSVQEAIAAGCSVVASSRVGSSYDLIEQGINGYQYKAGSVETLSKCMRQALTLDPGFKAQSNRQMLEKWSYETIAAALIIPDKSY